MELFPAIDLIDGGAVRLVQGDFARQQDYGDPRTLADRFLAAGARWLHLVDLDGARTGDPRNRPIIQAIAADPRARVQTGGGIRDEHDVTTLLGAGVRRVVLGTAALENPGWAAEMANRFPGQVALGLDYRPGADGQPEAAVRGWVAGSGRSVGDVLEELSGAPLGAVVVTAIERDGTLEGPDLAGLDAVLDATKIPVVASGGVGSADDLRALAQLRSSKGRTLAGSIVGKALVDGRVSMEEAIAACAPFE